MIIVIIKTSLIVSLKENTLRSPLDASLGRDLDWNFTQNRFDFRPIDWERGGERARERDDALDNFSKKSLAGDVIITMINAFRLDHVTSKFCRENENEKYKKYVLNKLKIGFLPFLADGVFRYFEATAWKKYF